MKLFLAQVATSDQGTNMTIVSEWTDNSDGAIMAFHAQARVLRGEASVLSYTVKILDEQLNVYDGYVESYAKPVEPEPEEP
jgi:hypothetical protein